MDRDSILIDTKAGKRNVNWLELHQLKKDILWIYNENTDGLKDSFIPLESFKSKYWEYVTIQGKSLSKTEIEFYRCGAMIISLCMIIEFIDTISGNQQIFGDVSINEVSDYINAFTSGNADEAKLKEIVILSLSIAGSMTEFDKRDSFGFTHPDMDQLFGSLEWVDKTFIKKHLNQA